jgi:hypothetical protein
MVKHSSGILYSTKKSSNDTLYQEIEQEVKDSIESYSHETITGETLTLGAGTVSEPSFHFTGDADCGIYKPISNTVAISAGNKAVGVFAPTTIDFDTTEFEIKDGIDILCRVNANGQILGDDRYSLGFSNPTFSFHNDEDTGLYLSAPSTLGFSTGGNEKVTFSFNTANFNNDIEIANTKELRTDRITTTTATPLVLDSTNGYTLNGDLTNSGQAHFLARKAIDQTVATGTATDIDFESDLSSSIVTRLLPTFSEFSFNTTGIFLLTAEIWLEGAITGAREAYFKSSASANLRYGYTRIESNNENNIKFTITSIINVNNPGSTIKLVCAQTSGGNMNFRGSSQFRHSDLSIVKLLREKKSDM